MDEDKRMNIYVSSPKSYQDVLNVFLFCKRKNWSSCPYPLVISTNHEVAYSDARVINSGNVNDSWVERSLQALRELDCKYVMLLCDDIFISRQINSYQITEILDYMDEHKINFCRLKPLKSGKQIEGIPFLSYVNRNTPYAINLQQGIFCREYLVRLLGDSGRSAWDIEGDLLKQASQADATLFDDVITCNREIFPVIHAVEKGKWFPTALKKVKQMGATVDSEREVISTIAEKKEIAIDYFVSFLKPETRKRIKLFATKMGYRFTNSN